MATHSSILPGETHGQRSLVRYSPWGDKELDRTEHASSYCPSQYWDPAGVGEPGGEWYLLGELWRLLVWFPL